MSAKLPPVDIIRCAIETALIVVITIPGMGSCEVRLKGECAELRRLMVTREHRRKGVATALLVAAADEARADGKIALSWTVRKDNGPALMFYFSRNAVVFYDDEEEYWMAVIFPTGQRRDFEKREIK
jgi:GNAT superfamily N-acetyltransferase